MSAISVIPSDLKMTSREIALVTGKEHFNVKRDISAMILQLNNPHLLLKDCPDFHPSDLNGHGITLSTFDHCGNAYDEFTLSQEYCLLLVSGYSVSLRQKIIKRWQELESQQQPKHILPQSFAEALMLAANQAAELEAARPAVAFVEKYVESTGNMGFRQVCKLLKIKENDFRAFLQDMKIMYRLGSEWMPYANHIDAGRFHVSTGTSDTDHAFNTAKFTPKGVEWVAKLWSEK
jgi:phage antirepressor YoqD-like protein